MRIKGEGEWTRRLMLEGRYSGWDGVKLEGMCRRRMR